MGGIAIEEMGGGATCEPIADMGEMSRAPRAAVKDLCAP
jgi:hypothetical protein